MKSRLTISARDLRAVVALLDPDRCGGPHEEVPVSFVTDLATLVPFSFASFILIDARHRDDHVQGVDVEEMTPSPP